MYPEEVIDAMISKSGKSANRISLELGKSRSNIRLTKGRKETQLRTIADIADVCDMDVVIIDRKTGEQVCKVDAPRNRN